jgi:hypothetical protein
MEFDSPASLLSERCGQVNGLELAVDENREGQLGMPILGFTGGAAAVGLAAPPTALDKTAGEHIAEQAEGADQAPTEFQLRVGGHKHI